MAVSGVGAPGAVFLKRQVLREKSIYIPVVPIIYPSRSQYLSIAAFQHERRFRVDALLRVTALHIP